MKISSAFPSNYLKAADLDGRVLTVTIAKVGMEQVSRGGELQPVVYFDGHRKGMVLNKTNAKKITEVYGDDTDQWINGKIILYTAMVEFQGDTVEALRVRHVAARENRAPEAFPESPPAISNQGSQTASLMVEAEAMTKQGIDAFRDWRDRLSPDEYKLIFPQMGKLIGMANGADSPIMLSESAKKTLKKHKPEEDKPQL